MGSRAGAGSCSTHGSRVGQVVQHTKRSGWLTRKMSGWHKEVGRLQVHARKSLGASEVAMSVWARGFFGFGLDFGVGQAGNHWTGSFEGACGPRFLV